MTIIELADSSSFRYLLSNSNTPATQNAHDMNALWFSVLNVFRFYWFGFVSFSFIFPPYTHTQTRIFFLLEHYAAAIMKFAEHLQAHITPEWRKQYINYEVSVFQDVLSSNMEIVC